MTYTHHITFLRHAESEGNVKNLFMGRDDHSLTENGRRQAYALSQRWAKEGKTFDTIIASPISRALDTAHTIAFELGLAIETDPLWMEQDFGEWNPVFIPDILRDPATPKYFTPYDRPGKTGETRIETYLRAGQAIHNLLSRPPGHYLIVAHGVILNMAMYFAFGIPCHPSSEGPWFAFHNTAFATLTFSPDRYRWHVLCLNDHRHLPEPPAIEEPDSYHIYFVRHGESEGNANSLWQGQSDFPLNDAGRKQAKVLAKYLSHKEQSLDLIIASPLSRARDTAVVVAEKFDLDVETDPVWIERDNGLWAGTSRENRNPPEPDYLFLHSPVGETGETQWELYLRGGQAIHKLLNHPPGKYLVVSHGGILNMVMHAALGITPFPNYQGLRFAFGNVGVCEVTYIPSRNRWLISGLVDLSQFEVTPEFQGSDQKIRLQAAREQIE